MPDVYDCYNTFLSSPGDVEKERQAAEDTILNINRSCTETLGLALDVKRWEHLPPETPHLPDERIQDILNKEVDKAHFFILIMFKRYGFVEPGHTISNTEREIETILRRFKDKPQLKILAYFRDLPENPAPDEQEQKVRDLKLRLQKIGVLFKSYRNPEEFKELLTHDLYNVILKMRLSPFKQEALRHFWQFGKAERPTHPRVVVLYPPVQREFMGNPEDTKFWKKRLEPNIFFEDFKAIHKIQKSMMILGFHDYRVHTHADAPGDIHFMNRVWVCAPRHPRALEQLTKYETVSRFRFLPRTHKRNARIVWRSQDGSNVEVPSPLGQYLRQQRQSHDTQDEWTQEMGKVMAKDFAVLARFADRASEDLTIEGYLQDYFFAGIRGLGTWGVGWYIDRKYKHLMSLPTNQDIQLLLEVTFTNDRIYDVLDVSEKPADYFRSENNPATIRDKIRHFRDARQVV